MATDARLARVSPRTIVPILAVLLVAGAASAAPSSPPTAQPIVINLWPEGVPLSQPNAPAEHVEDGRVYNVNVPTLTLFAPPAGTANGTAAIVCPAAATRAWRSTRRARSCSAGSTAWA